MYRQTVHRIGIVTAVGFALGWHGLVRPGNVHAQSFLEQLEKRLTEGAPSEPAAENGPPATADQSAGKATLGIVGDNLVDGGRGVEVLSVKSGGAADRAGIRAADVITKIDDSPIGGMDDLAAVLGKRRPGERVEFTVQRQGAELQLAVQLGRKDAAGNDGPVDPFDDGVSAPTPRSPLNLSAPADQGAPSAEIDGRRPTLGVTVINVTDDARFRYGLPVRSGAVIQTVTPGSAADQARLPVGAAIVAFDGRRIDSSNDLTREVRAARPGQQVQISYYTGNQLRRVQVRLADASDAAPAASPGGPRVRLPRGPILDRVEQLLDNLVQPQPGQPQLAQPQLAQPQLAQPQPARPGTPAAVSPNGGPAIDPAMLETLTKQLEVLNRNLQTLTDRVERLEKRLDAIEPNLDAQIDDAR